MGGEWVTLFNRWHGIFYMLGRTDMVGHIRRLLIIQSWTTEERSRWL